MIGKMGSSAQTFPQNSLQIILGEKILTLFFPRSLGRALGKKPFSLCSFGLGGLKPQIPKIYGESAPPRHQATQAEGNHRENWGFSTDIFSQSSFQGPWGKIRAEFFINPKVLRESSVEKPGLTNPPFSLWFFVTWNLKFPKFMGRRPLHSTQATQAKGNPRENWGFSTQIFPESSFQGPRGKTRFNKTFFIQRSLERAVGKSELKTPHFPMVSPWEFAGSK